MSQEGTQFMVWTAVRLAMHDNTRWVFPMITASSDDKNLNHKVV